MRSESEAAHEARPPGLLVMLAALLPFGLGYFLSYLYRAANAVVAPDLVRDIGLSAGELGLLTSAYLLAFALFQLPLGILLDRYGPRRVQAALVAIGGLGAVVFGLGQDARTLLLARAIIGLGFAGGLMSAFKAVVIWVPEPRRALANSCVMSIGALGLLVATAPLEAAVQAFGWRHVFLGVAAFTMLVAVLILVVVPERGAPERATAERGTPERGAPEREAAKQAISVRAQIGEVAQILRNPVVLALAPLLAITVGVHVSIQTLWVGPWFRDVGGLDRTAVANRLFVMAAAFFAGILITGAVADWLARRGVSLLNVMLGFMMIFFLAQACIIFELEGHDMLIWSLFGMTGQVSVLAFPWLSSYFGAALSGRANTAVNLPMFMSAFAFQYAIGAVIDLYPLSPAGGYAPDAYATAFAILLAAELAALLWYLSNRHHIATAEQIVQAAYRARATGGKA